MTTDWNAATREAVAHLQALIRIPTVNPPGDELACAQYVYGVLAREGIDVRLLEPAPRRGIVVARLDAQAREPAGRRKGPGPLLLLAHMDVVGVERERWTVDPFGGEIRDGYVYGRGAIDDKGMLAAYLVAMVLAKRLLVDEGVTLARDLVLIASADEETGSQWGVEWLLARHADLLRAEFALNEGGRIRVVDGQPLYAAVQTAEKVPHGIRVTARGTSGHASVPLPDNAIVRLARALAVIGAHREPLTLVPTTRRFFETLSAVWPDDAERSAMADLMSAESERRRGGEAVLARLPSLDALTRNGISPTIISGGNRENVIPSEATAVLNVRTLPGESPDDVLQRLAAAVGDPMVEMTMTSRGTDAPASDFESPLFEVIAETLTSLDSRLTVVPYMSTGATDSARLREAGVQTFGLLPFPMPAEDEARMHGNDERLSLEALAFGVKAVYGIVKRMLVAAR